MLLNLVFDDGNDPDEGYVTAIYQAGPYVLQLKQKPAEGNLILNESDKEEVQPEEQHTTESFPNVGLIVWRSAFVLAEYLLRLKPFPTWSDVGCVELGCGVGVLGIALAMAGANVIMTDLEHITPLAQENADLNSAVTKGDLKVVTFPWGEDPQAAGLHPPDLLVAADVLYEPQYYDKLLDSLVRLHGPQTKTYLCYRHRGSYLEETFEGRARAAGFRVEKVPDDQLGTDYQGQGFQLYQLFR